MGSWGEKLFDDDTACDVRDSYLALLSDGETGPAATDLLLKRFDETIRDEDEAAVFWLALAAAQQKVGRLEPRIKTRALEVLEHGTGLGRWREAGPTPLRRRLAALEMVKQQILAPPPPEKRIAPRFRDACAWEAGDVISYKLTSGTFALFCVVGLAEHANGQSPVCELLDWMGADPPSIDVLGKLPFRRGALPPEVMLRALAATYAEYQENPTGAIQLMLADLGRIPPPNLETGYDPRHIGALTETIHLLGTGDAKLRKNVIEFARVRKPALIQPITQISLQREQQKSELPARRVRRLKVKRQPGQPLGEWLVIRWYELDDALRDVFSLGG